MNVTRTRVKTEAHVMMKSMASRAHAHQVTRLRCVQPTLMIAWTSFVKMVVHVVMG